MASLPYPIGRLDAQVFRTEEVGHGLRLFSAKQPHIRVHRFCSSSDSLFDVAEHMRSAALQLNFEVARATRGGVRTVESARSHIVVVNVYGRLGDVDEPALQGIEQTGRGLVRAADALRSAFAIQSTAVRGALSE